MLAPPISLPLSGAIPGFSALPEILLGGRRVFHTATFAESHLLAFLQKRRRMWFSVRGVERDPVGFASRHPLSCLGHLCHSYSFLFVVEDHGAKRRDWAHHLPREALSPVSVIGRTPCSRVPFGSPTRTTYTSLAQIKHRPRRARRGLRVPLAPRESTVS